MPLPNPEIVDETVMPPELDAEIRQALCRCFPADVAVFSQTRTWHGSGPAYSALIMNAGRPIAHVGVVDRTIRIGSQQFRAAGIQNVFVLPEYRGQGLSDAVMTAAAREAQDRHFDLGLLFCGPALEKVYARVGWKLIPNEVLRIDDDGGEKPLPGNNVTMFLPLRQRQVPPGVIYLQGNDW